MVNGLPAEMEIPDTTIPYVGFRVWDFRWGRMNGAATDKIGVLHAINSFAAWNSEGKTVAECKPTPPFITTNGVGPCEDLSPSDDCPHSCGLHAFHTVEVLKSKFRYEPPVGLRIVGAVLGWGHMVRHEDEGWRAQYAIPIAFLPLRDPAYQPSPAVNRARKDLEVIADQLGAVYCKDYQDLTEFAYSKGARWIEKPILP